MKSSTLAAATLVAAAAADSLVVPTNLEVTAITSIQDVSKTLAAGVMSFYNGTAETYADLPTPYYWWECGAMFGAMLDYSYYTSDSSYDDIIATALAAQVGPNFDLMLPSHYGDEGNDDQAFWGFNMLAAAERNFPQPAGLSVSWQQIGENIWNSIIPRWNTSSCGGGVAWQIFESNPNGMDYKNSVSNGGLFQLSARLAALTGNQTYADWAARIWDWSVEVGFVDDQFNVYDGASSAENCSTINPLTFTYGSGIYLYGAAVMANLTSSSTWESRAAGIVSAARTSFFSGGPDANVTNVLWERACEGVGTCNTDMKSFKGYISRFMAASAAQLPSLASDIQSVLQASANAASATCSGASIEGLSGAVSFQAGTACGQKWYTGGFDGSTGLGQQMSVLETVQGLLVLPGSGNTLNVYDGQTKNTEQSSTASTSSAASTSTVSTSTASTSSQQVEAAAVTSSASASSTSAATSSAASASAPAATAVAATSANITTIKTTKYETVNCNSSSAVFTNATFSKGVAKPTGFANLNATSTFATKPTGGATASTSEVLITNTASRTASSSTSVGATSTSTPVFSGASGMSFQWTVLGTTMSAVFLAWGMM